MEKLPQEFFRAGAVLTIKPGLIRVGWGNRQRTAAPIHGNSPFYAPDFFLADPLPWWTPSDWRDLDIASALEAFPQESLAEKPNWQQPDFEAYGSVFEDWQSQFKSGKLTKAVSVVFSRLPGVHAFEGFTSTLNPCGPKSDLRHLERARGNAGSDSGAASFAGLRF